MLKDVNGNELAGGDEVLLRCRVIGPMGGSPDSFVTVEAMDTPSTASEAQYHPRFTCNPGFFQKVGPLPPADVPTEPAHKTPKGRRPRTKTP